MNRSLYHTSCFIPGVLVGCIMWQRLNPSQFLFHFFLQSSHVATQISLEYRTVNFSAAGSKWLTSWTCTAAPPMLGFASTKGKLFAIDTFPKSVIRDTCRWVMLILRTKTIFLMTWKVNYTVQTAVISDDFTSSFVKSWDLMATVWWDIYFSIHVNKATMWVTVWRPSFSINHVYISIMSLFYMCMMSVSWWRFFLFVLSRVWQ